MGIAWMASWSPFDGDQHDELQHVRRAVRAQDQPAVGILAKAC